MQKTLEEITSGSSSETLEQKESRNDALLLAQKGEHFLCDQKKIFAITGTTEEEFIDTMSNTSSKDLLKNPCPHYELPHFMAFNYFNFLSDPQDAADQYKISAFHDDAPSLTATIPALIYGRAGEHLKGATLWYDRYLSLTDDENQENSAVVALSKAIFEMQLELISE